MTRAAFLLVWNPVRLNLGSTSDRIFNLDVQRDMVAPRADGFHWHGEPLSAECRQLRMRVSTLGIGSSKGVTAKGGIFVGRANSELEITPGRAPPPSIGLEESTESIALALSFSQS